MQPTRLGTKEHAHSDTHSKQTRLSWPCNCGVRCQTGQAHNEAKKGTKYSGNNVGARGAQALSEALKANTTLLALGLDSEQQAHKKRKEGFKYSKTDNKIGPQGARAIGEALKNNTTLTVLQIGGECLGGETQDNGPHSTTNTNTDNGIGVGGARALSDALRNNATLTELNALREQGAPLEVLKEHTAHETGGAEQETKLAKKACVR